MMFCNNGLVAALMNAECEIRRLELLNENLRGQIDGLRHLLNQRDVEVGAANAACKKLMDSMSATKNALSVSGGNKITYPERASVYASAIEHFGDCVQAMKAIEEMSELTKELSKWRIGEGNMDKIAEELADVTIMMEQLRLMFDINAEVCAHMDGKVARLQMRIEADK